MEQKKILLKAKKLIFSYNNKNFLPYKDSIFYFATYDEKSVKLLKRASTVLNKRDLYDDEYKDYIEKYKDFLRIVRKKR